MVYNYLSFAALRDSFQFPAGIVKDSPARHFPAIKRQQNYAAKIAAHYDISWNVVTARAYSGCNPCSCKVDRPEPQKVKFDRPTFCDRKANMPQARSTGQGRLDGKTLSPAQILVQLLQYIACSRNGACRIVGRRQAQGFDIGVQKLKSPFFPFQQRPGKRRLPRAVRAGEDQHTRLAFAVHEGLCATIV